MTDTVKICYFSATSNEIPNLSRALLSVKEKGYELDVFARTKLQLKDAKARSHFVEKALAADVVFICLMAGSQSCPAWDKLLAGLEKLDQDGNKRPHFHIQPTGTSQEVFNLVDEYSDGKEDKSWEKLHRYYRCGGVDNMAGLLRTMVTMFAGVEQLPPDSPLQPPCELPKEGIYHPQKGVFVDPAQYLAELDPDRSTMGIWFYQNFWLTGNKAHIDAIIGEVEKQGANALAVFHMRYRDKTLDNKDPVYIIDHFFKKDGKPLIDALINPVMFSLTSIDQSYLDCLKSLDVPLIQAIASSRSWEEWQASDQGLNNIDITMSVVQPEFDGAIINVPVAAKQMSDIDPLTGAAIYRYVPHGERPAKMVRLAMNWGALRRKANKDKKVAIILHHYPPRNDRIGCASGLDSFASIKRLLEEMESEGYHIGYQYEKIDDLAQEIVNGMTCDQRFLMPEQMAARAGAKAGPDLYQAWHQGLPPEVQEKMTGDWGEMPGNLFVHDKELLFPGVINGNVFISVQPPRGYLEEIDKLYHDLHLSPPHHYLAFYRYVKEVFKADVVMHVGKHGSLEWLPGKSVGLSETCYPDLAIMDLPNIYPYIINDPGEGTQAKRRSFAAIIDHLPPPQTNADLYEDLAELDNLLKEYGEAATQDQGKLKILESMIWEACEEAALDRDLALSKENALADVPAFLEKIHDTLGEIRDTMIADGLHIMGKEPQGKQLVEYLVQLTRLAQGDVPSLRRTVIKAMGYDCDYVLENRGKPVADQLTGSQIIEQAHNFCLRLFTMLQLENFHPDAVKGLVDFHFDKEQQTITEILTFAINDILPRLQQTSDEIANSIRGLRGGFIPPGSSGAPSRGQTHILPTGRNFFSLDPQKIPSPAAWETGCKLADALIERYLDGYGAYPDSVGLILWASPTMRSKGDDVAEILYLLGVRPVWQKGSGNVKDIEVIPATELKRPRIDVIPRMSGIFRDAFPHLVDLIDKAVQMVATLTEDIESNFIRRHVVADMAELIKQGVSDDKAFREATFRIFGSPPGSYGTGVAQLIESKAWENVDDLGEMYIKWSSHAYGKEVFGQTVEHAFRRNLGRVSVTVKNEDSREKDMMTCTDFYSYHGGLITAVKAVSGERPFSLSGDSADPETPLVRSTREEARHVFRSRLVNPKWLGGLKKHGYKGAGDISKAMDILFGWDATADVVEDWMYERFARKVPLDPEMQEWMKEVNPYALQNILDKLLEAGSRGMWQVEPDLEQEMRDAYLDIEGDIEERTEA